MTTCKHRHLSLAMTLALGIAPAFPVRAALDAAVVQRLLAGPHLDQAEVARLSRLALLDADGVAGLQRQLDALAGQGAAAAQARARLAQACLHWQQGDAGAAMAAVEQALALAPGIDGWELKARLLDAQGRPREALGWYEKAEAASRDPAEQARLRLRITLIEAVNQPQALVDLGQRLSPTAADHAADALALLARPDAALALYRPEPGRPAYPQALRQASWAIAAGNGHAAAEQAWKAFTVATTAEDRRYALALLVEAFRDRHDLAGAEVWLAAHPGGSDVAQARVDVLLEMQRYDAAIALVRNAADPALRQRLLGILGLAGRTEAAEAEYRRRIEADPHQAEAYDGLATLYLGQGDPARALAVYRDLFARNRGRIEVLLPATRRMIAMGLAEPATAMIAEAGRDPAFAVPVQFLLSETWRSQGQDARARTVLDGLRKQLPEDSAQRADLADDYQTLGDPVAAREVLQALEHHRALDYDQQVQLAELDLDSGQPEQALARWRLLWAQAQLPARKNYLETQIIRTAAQLGRLDALAAELEAGLAKGALAPDQLDLLVAVRLELRERDSRSTDIQVNAGNTQVGVQVAHWDRNATEAAIEGYLARAGLDEKQRLARLGEAYARLHDEDKLDRTLRQLVQADPDNADLYLRRLILNALRAPLDGETPQQQQARVDALLRQLQARHGRDPADTARFTAGVYAMAGLTDPAIAQYRRALALAPGNADDLLQLADLLKKQQQRSAAAALLQDAAERATSQAGFASAIDGLIDLFAADPAAQGKATGQAQLARQALLWAQRRVLERIAGEGLDLRLATLLADLGQALGDPDLQLRAYDAALAVADEQRPALLRQLVTLNSASTPGSGGTGPALGDLKQKLVYGRRLLALKREYPPELYADLARALLAEADTAGAERAFAMMSDIGGLVDVDRIRGDAYASTGYPDQALASYSRALLRNRDDLDLITRSSILREQAGQPAQANQAYWHGLQVLLQRLPQRGQDTPQAAALDVRQFYPTLVEGLLLTWPQAPAQRQALREQVQRAYADALAELGPAPQGTLAGYPRLALAARMQRRVAEFLGDDALAQAVADGLGRAFPHDPAMQRDSQAYRDLAGLPAPAVAPSPAADWVEQGLGRQARDTDNFDLRLALATAAGDRATLAELVQQALEAEAAARTASGKGQDSRFHPALLYGLVLGSMDRLPPAQFDAQVYAPLDKAPFRDQVLFDIFRTRPERYAALEKIVGHRLLDDDVLLRMIVVHGNDPLPQSPLAFGARRHGGPGGRGANPMDGMLAHFPLQRQIALYGALVDQMERTGAESSLQDMLLRRFFGQPLGAAEQAQLAPILKRDVLFPRDPQVRSAAFAVRRLLVLDADPGNRPLLLDAAGAVAARYPDGAHLPAFLRAYFDGDRREAFAQLTALYADTDAHVQVGNYAEQLTEQYFPEERQKRIARFLAASAPSDAQVQDFYSAFAVAAINGDEQEQAAVAGYYARLHALRPDNTVYLGGLLYALWRQDRRAEAAAALRPYVDANPDDREAATVLVLMDRVLQQPQAAQAVAKASGVDVDDAGWMVEMTNRASLPREGIFEPDFRTLFNLAFEAWSDAHPDAPVVVEIARRRSEQPHPLEVAADGGLHRLADALDGPAAALPGVLRGVWRDSAPGLTGDEEVPPRSPLLQALAAVAAGQSGPGAPEHADALRKAVLATPALADEIDRELQALDAETRQRQQPLYALLGQALLAQGRAAARLDALLQALPDGRLGDHALTLLAVLADADGRVLDPAQRQALQVRLQRTPVLAPGQRLLLARLFVRAGDPGTAQALLRAATLQVLYPDAAARAAEAGTGVDLERIVAELARWPDRQAAARVHALLAQCVAQGMPGLVLPPLPEATAGEGRPQP